MNLLEMFLKGGVIMYPILLCLIVMVGITIERLFALGKAQVGIGQFMVKVRSIFQKGDTDAVLMFCSQKNVPIANIIRRAMMKYDFGDEKVREAVEDAKKEEVYHLKKRLSLLAGIAGVAPMLGLLGTAMGLVMAFQRIEGLGGIMNPADLSAIIWKPLVVTVFGLVVGIPAFTLYWYFVSRVARCVHEMEGTTTEFLDLLRRKPRQEIPLRVQDETVSTPRAAKPVSTLVFEDDAYFRRKV